MAKLTPAEQKAADRLLETTRALQGIPEHVEDPAVIERVAAILRTGAKKPAPAKKPKKSGGTAA